ncbi:MAG: ABC-type transporter, integral membrane subunit [Acetothermia bacterium 64_32]|nr:MAG: ABC-type transporter, integral membrane subunit [Acetothermia bacterium 64_32]MBC7098729.1 ABC transporter permease [Candidatus Bipolaricaulota bacterium]HAF70751.1 peptide ABC transporter permease [Candidatus Acetothermia bacterium]
MTRWLVQAVLWPFRRLQAGRRAIRHQTLLKVGLFIVISFILMAIICGPQGRGRYGRIPGVPPYNPEKSYPEFPRLAPPSAAHWMGTDHLQRDVFSRVIAGGWAPIVVAFASIAIALSVGSLIGWISGYIGGWPDRALSLTMDAIYSFPSMILAIALVAVIGTGITPMIAAISFVYVPTYFRITRAEVLKVREQTFVEAARAVGVSGTRLLLRHIAPNTVNAIMAVSSFNIADAILTEAALSFLGYGLPPPAPDWGFDIQNGQRFLQAGYWWLITFPGLMILTLSLGFGLIGEGISDLVNPKRRRKKIG